MKKEAKGRSWDVPVPTSWFGGNLADGLPPASSYSFPTIIACIPTIMRNVHVVGTCLQTMIISAMSAHHYEAPRTVADLGG